MGTHKLSIGAHSIMKLVFAEYLAALREREELDLLMPDLLSEIGFTVLSRPAIGTKQYGVDVAAVGDPGDGIRRLYLLSIKPRDLRRSDWNNNEQSLRPSLDQIRDVYVEKLVPKRYRQIPIVIVLCIGGQVHEDVKVDVDGYTDTNETGRIKYEIWNGDYLAGLLLTGVLRENALPKGGRSNLRKSIALVDEPEAGFGHFCKFVSDIRNNCKPTRRGRLTAIRQIYVALWTVYVWARDAGNLEAAYQCSERSLLEAWPLIEGYLNGKSREAKQLGQTMQRLIGLHQTIGADFIGQSVEPRAKDIHALSSAVRSDSALDVNLRLFDVIGRVGTSGLWAQHVVSQMESGDDKEAPKQMRERLLDLAQLIADLVSNNPALNTPIKDSHAIDINIACLFLARVGCYDVVRVWVRQISNATIFAYKTDGSYPCIYDEYRKLVDHPIREDSYRLAATAGSILVPTLAVWAAITEDQETLKLLEEFAKDDYAHSNLQVWYPGGDTEENLYRGSANHGLCAHPIKITRSLEDMLGPMSDERKASTEFWSLSAVKRGIWPLIVVARLHHRVPVPPHFWPITRGAADSKAR